MISLQDIHFVRGKQSILQSVNLHMNEGENWVILGRNGSGKTTLLEILTGYLFPTTGQVQVNGYPYGSCDVREARKSIGYISQSLLEKLTLRDPLWEVVATGEYGILRFYEPVPESLKEKTIKMLEFVGLAHLSDQPLGALSQGERKKAMLARSLMTEPSLMIMDEPCAGLDLYEREHLLKDLKTFHEQGIQMVYVTHHIEEIVPIFSHVLLLQEGKVIAKGEKETVLTAPYLQAAFDTEIDVKWTHGRPWIRVLE